MPVVRTDGRLLGRAVYVHVIPNFLGWVDLLSYGTPQSRDSRARRAPLLTELIYTFRDGLNFGEGIVSIQLATTALIQVSLYFSAALITKFSYPRCTAARARALPKMFVVNQDVQNAKIDLSRGSHFVSGDLKSFVYAELAS